MASYDAFAQYAPTSASAFTLGISAEQPTPDCEGLSRAREKEALRRRLFEMILRNERLRRTKPR